MALLGGKSAGKNGAPSHPLAAALSPVLRKAAAPPGRSWAAGALLTEASATQRAVEAFV